MYRLICIILLVTFPFFGCHYKDTPKVLVIGDSISIGYTPALKRQLNDHVRVRHIGENAGGTKNGLERIDSWIGKNDFDVILFNWGLWDLTYRLSPDNGLGVKDKINGTIETAPDEYANNLIEIIQKLATTNAKLFFVTTTFVPDEEPGMFTKDVTRYNAMAIEVMNAYSIDVLDIYLKSEEIHDKHGKGLNDVHYKPEGYRELGRIIANMLLPELANICQHQEFN